MGDCLGTPGTVDFLLLSRPNGIRTRLRTLVPYRNFLAPLSYAL